MYSQAQKLMSCLQVTKMNKAKTILSINSTWQTIRLSSSWISLNKHCTKTTKSQSTSDVGPFVHTRWYSSDSECHVVKSPYPDVTLPTTCLVEYIWETLDQWPDKTAFVCGITGRSYTFAQTRAMCRRFAASLLRAGFQKGDVLSIIMPNLPEYPIVLLGAIEAGLLATTTNPIYTAYEVAKQIVDSNAKCIVTVADKYPTIVEALKLVKRNEQKISVIIADGFNGLPTGTIDLKEMISDDIDTSAVSHVPPSHYEDVAILPYSSGTSGLPKGVMLTHRNLVSNIIQVLHPEINILEDTTRDYQEVILAVLPFYHIYGMEFLLLEKIRKGRKVVTLPKFDPTIFLRELVAHKATILYMVPPLIMFLGSHPNVKGKHLETVKYIINGAASIGVADILKVMDKAPNLRYVQGYGLTETSPLLLVTPKSDPLTASVGVPVQNTQCKIVNTDTGENLPPGEIGELCGKGPQLMKGYHNKPEATAEAIDSSGWFHTGDLGYYDTDKKFYIVDRLKELIKVKGLQVAPNELEELLRTHPNINDAAVIGIPDPRSGEVPRAFVICKDPTQITEEEVKQFVASRVAPFKHLEGGVEFVTSIPRNPSGKILRRELKEQFQKQ